MERGTRQRLSREQVVDAALRLLDETGLEGVTLRGVATKLNVQAPALYWHVRNKKELLDEMATALLREAFAGAPDAAEAAAPTEGAAPAEWEELLAEPYRRLRRVLLQHRDGAKVFAGTRLTDAGHGPWQEDLLRSLVDAGFSVQAASRSAFLLLAFTEGFVIEEQEVYPTPGERAAGYELQERALQLGAAENPLTVQAGAELFTDFETRFEEGLRTLLAGIAATLGPR